MRKEKGLKRKKGLSCRNIFSSLSKYIDKELDDSLREQIDRHIGNCKPCKAFLNTLRKTIRLCNKFKPEYVFQIQRVKLNKDVEEEIKAFTHFFGQTR